MVLNIYINTLLHLSSEFLVVSAYSYFEFEVLSMSGMEYIDNI